MQNVCGMRFGGRGGKNMARISNYEKTGLSKGIVDDINKTIFGVHNSKVSLK